MSTPPFEIQTKILRRGLSPDDYKLYRAALEWDLQDPIVIESRHDLKSEYLWRDRLEPYHHQVTNLITFCRRLPVTLLADDVGLGKTISAGLIASELISRAHVSRILIVCPKLLGPQWRDELQTKFNIPAEIVTGSELVQAEPDGVGAIITTYHSARAHLEKIPDDRYEMLVLDEAHKLRNLYGVDPPPQVAVKFRKALEARRFRYVLMLTATPIHNRLWDLYSLIDLLTVARGHQNPFGSEGMFARKFIADDREKARQLKFEAREEFRSIVYGYMSRVRRNDAKLYFPDRVVQLHRAEPTSVELELIQVLAEPIQKLNRLAQISILQALTSSPQALMAQLKTMARNGTVPQDLASSVQSIVGNMPTSAKLQALESLVQQLRRDQGECWRMVVFTGRLETQTTIQDFLEAEGISVGIINGSSGQRNQDTLARFRRNPPDCHVIVSTEAGSEGINLQVANVLVNYDLPWNPMIVEQRIGRVQRLASEHASVSIFNVILRGTFEEYIVGRLMEKLQMAAHAVGDVEALLEASGVDDDNNSSAPSFEEKIRHLVIAALAGKDVQAATQQAEKSIADAKDELEREEKNINTLLGSMDGAEYVGPRAPTLPTAHPSIGARDFTLAALKSLGARVTPQSAGVYLAEKNGGREYVRFTQEAGRANAGTLYAPGSPAFSRLVDQVVATGIHQIDDVDSCTARSCAEVAVLWAKGLDASLINAKTTEVRRCLDGHAVVRVRATVSHDSYERLVEVHCSPTDHNVPAPGPSLEPAGEIIEHAASVGLNLQKLKEQALADRGVTEFCRFYLERRAQEVEAAGEDARKRQKLEDDFTPRLEMMLFAVGGSINRTVTVRVEYRFDNSPTYTSKISIVPSTNALVSAPEMVRCSSTGRSVPRDCIARCDLSGADTLRHLLVKSDVSNRRALPEYVLRCSLSGKSLLKDEAEQSGVSGRPVYPPLLRTSDLSGRRGEPKHFGRCEFTDAEALLSELAVSDVSGRRYRADEQARSAVSGKAGHFSELLVCDETRQPMLVAEAEQCDVTGKHVRQGFLQCCAVTRKNVLPFELGRCSISGKKALKSLLVNSSVSDADILEELAVRSAHGQFCTPSETRACAWSGRKCHPDDLVVCELAGVSVHFEFTIAQPTTRLESLSELLNGTRRNADSRELWEAISVKASQALRAKCQVQAAFASPDRQQLAICAEVRTLLGLKVRHVGLLYSLDDRAIVGHIALGRRGQSGWVAAA